MRGRPLAPGVTGCCWLSVRRPVIFDRREASAASLRSDEALPIASNLTLKSGPTIRTIEADLARLEQSPMNGSSTLQIPHHLRAAEPGALGAAMQYICTWARQSTDPVLRTYVTSPDDEHGMRTLVGEGHGLVAALMAGRAIDRSLRPIDRPLRRVVLQQLDESADRRGGSGRPDVRCSSPLTIRCGRLRPLSTGPGAALRRSATSPASSS